MIRLRTPFLAAALFTGVAAVGLTPGLGANRAGAGEFHCRTKRGAPSRRWGG